MTFISQQPTKLQILGQVEQWQWSDKISTDQIHNKMSVTMVSSSHPVVDIQPTASISENDEKHNDAAALVEAHKLDKIYFT